jgi:hypothetical protein
MQMEKAYDPKALVGKLKDKGLDVAEDAAKAVVESVFEWTEESAKISATKVDDMIVGVAAPIKGFVLEQVDKIDGQAG